MLILYPLGKEEEQFRNLKNITLLHISVVSLSSMQFEVLKSVREWKQSTHIVIKFTYKKKFKIYGTLIMKLW